VNYLYRLDSNLNPPDLSLQSSKDYRCEPPATGSFIIKLILRKLAAVSMEKSKLNLEF
jgi:hypothetical protein